MLTTSKSLLAGVMLVSLLLGGAQVDKANYDYIRPFIAGAEFTNPEIFETCIGISFYVHKVLETSLNVP